MDNENKTTVSLGGFSLSAFLTILFLILKLCGVITWPWIWVFAPLWISAGLVVLIFAITFLVILIGAIIASID